MHPQYYFALAALFVCVAGLSYRVVRLIRMGTPHDYSRPLGNPGDGIRYSFLGAMNPAHKESAYLHLPTYAAGLIFHLGTFLSFALLPFFFFEFQLSGLVSKTIIVILAVSGSCGIGIFVKRIALKKLRSLSNPDDYVSNLLVTLFQSCTIVVVANESFAPIYFVFAGLLLLYLPLGKLRHFLYFFVARYQLGFHYGWRGVWPGGIKR